MDRRLRQLERAFADGDESAGYALFHELERLGEDERAVEVLLRLPNEILSPTELVQRQFHYGRRALEGLARNMEQRTNEHGCLIAANYGGGHDPNDLDEIAATTRAGFVDFPWRVLYVTPFQEVLSSPLLLAEVGVTEGDLHIVLCPSREAYVAQTESACEFYEIAVPDWVYGG